MLNQISMLIISIPINLFTTLILLRLLLQISRADFYNPLSQFIVKVTNPLLKLFRRFIPGFWGFDFAALVLAIFIQSIGVFLSNYLNENITPNITTYLLNGFIGVIAVFLEIIFFIILIMVVISWVSPNSYHPAASIIRQISEPILSPFRRLLPNIAGLDFSPMLALIIISIAQAFFN